MTTHSEPFSQKIRSAFALRTRLHALRWAMMSPAARQRWVDERLRASESGWLFILGVNNSGTTLLANVLESHPDMRGLEREGQHLSRALPVASDYGISGLWTQRPDLFRWTEENDATPAVRATFDWARHYAPGRGMLIEKSPPNTIRSRWLQANFRPSQFLATTRSPYAQCEGAHRRAGHPIDVAAKHWAQANGWLLDDIEHLDRCLVVSYEGLCDHTEETLRRIESFLEVKPFDRDTLTRDYSTRSIEGTPSPIRNMNDRSIARLSAADIDTINQIARGVMERLGYEVLEPESAGH